MSCSLAILAFIAGYSISSWRSQQLLREEKSKEKKEEEEGEEEGEEEDEFSDEGESSEEEEIVDNVRYKLVFVVRNDLNMTKGKIASQVGHATLGAYKRGLKHFPKQLKSWSRTGQAKVVLRVQKEEELLEVEKAAEEAGLNHYMVLDAGRTQIESGSKTVLAVGPDVIDKVDQVTKSLKLL